MTGLPARRVELVGTRKPDADWTVRIAIGGAAGFTLLLVAFGFILYRSWPQMSGSDRAMHALSDKTDRIASGQETLSRDIASLRTDLRSNRTDNADGSREVAVLRARVGDLSNTVASLREQTDKLEAASREAPAALPPVAPAPALPAPAPAQPDPAVTELRNRLDALQRKLDQLAAAPPAPPSPAPLPQTASPVLVDATPVKPAAPRPPSYPVDEIEREVRDMQTVINQQKARATGAARLAGTPVPFVTPTPAPRTSGIADPLAPITSKTPPRIAPTRPTPGPSGARAVSPTVSRVPSEPFAQQTVKPSTHSTGPEPRISSVGANSAMKSIGPLGLPFDAIGNLFAAIGEGLDTLFTGREYLPRPTEDEGPSTARAAR